MPPLVVALLLAAAPDAATEPPRAAFFLTGRRLKEVCEAGDDLSLGTCVGYIDSVVDAALFRDTYQRPRRVCITARVTNADLRRAVLADLARDANGLRLPAFTYVERAVTAAWPCPAAPPPAR
jgi:hypothetical protein